MRAEPAAPEIVREALSNFSYGQAAGVGGDNGPGLADALDLAKLRPLQVQILDDCLDDPVHFPKFR